MKVFSAKPREYAKKAAAQQVKWHQDHQIYTGITETARDIRRNEGRVFLHGGRHGDDEDEMKQADRHKYCKRTGKKRYRRPEICMLLLPAVSELLGCDPDNKKKYRSNKYDIRFKGCLAQSYKESADSGSSR